MAALSVWLLSLLLYVCSLLFGCLGFRYGMRLLNTINVIYKHIIYKWGSRAKTRICLYMADKQQQRRNINEIWKNAHTHTLTHSHKDRDEKNWNHNTKIQSSILLLSPWLLLYLFMAKHIKCTHTLTRAMHTYCGGRRNKMLISFNEKRLNANFTHAAMTECKTVFHI